MEKRRRELLTLLGVAASGTVAGCASFDTNATTSPDRSPADTDNDSLTPTATQREDSSDSAKLVPDDGDAEDKFGGSVALSGDGTTALIGAPGDEDPNGEEAGSAYVFDWTGNTWTQTTKLTPDDGNNRDLFGVTVALSNDGATALIGADTDEDPNGEYAGAVYVFDRRGDTWTQTAKLAPDDGDGRDIFGSGVALSGDGTTALIGAYWDEDPNGEKAGSAYVFDRTESTWTQTTKLTPDDGDDHDNFGSSVAIAGDGSTALIGAFHDEDPNGEKAGSAYVFDRSGDSWTQTAKLTPDDGDSHDRFSVSVSLSHDGTTALIGAWVDEDPNGPAGGSAYVFTRSEATWTQTTKLTSDDGDDRDNFGQAALSSDGSTAVISAVRDEDPNGEKAGSAYVFTRSEATWTQAEKLIPDDGDDGDWFGWGVALSGDGATALIGAHKDEDPNGENAGSAYVFVL